MLFFEHCYAANSTRQRPASAGVPAQQTFQGTLTPVLQAIRGPGYAGVTRTQAAHTALKIAMQPNLVEFPLSNTGLSGNYDNTGILYLIPFLRPCPSTESPAFQVVSRVIDGYALVQGWPWRRVYLRKSSAVRAKSSVASGKVLSSSKSKPGWWWGLSRPVEASADPTQK